MDEVYLVYKTDNHHSYASRDIIGVCTDWTMALDVVGQQVRKEGEEIDDDQLFNLQTLKQTQGYSGEGEFHIEHIDEVNCLL